MQIRAAKYKEVLAGIRGRWFHALGTQMGMFHAVDLHIEKANKCRRDFLEADKVSKSANKDYLTNLKIMADKIDEHETSMKEEAMGCEL